MMLFQTWVNMKVTKRVSLIFLLGIIILWLNSSSVKAGATAGNSGVAVLLVDTDRVMGNIDEDIYGHFLEHINHSVVDGLFAEQIRGRGFEADDFKTYCEVFADNGSVQVADVKF